MPYCLVKGKLFFILMKTKPGIKQTDFPAQVKQLIKNQVLVR